MRGRRRIGVVPQLTRRAWEDAAQELQDFLRRIWDSEANGIPAGVTTDTPTTIQAGATATLGTEASGWEPGDHQHAVDTATAAALTASSTSTEGTGTALARADHTHDVSAIVDEAMIFAIIFGGK